MQHGATTRRVRELSQRFGADRSTIARWRVFWNEQFPQTPFWKIARGRLVPVYEMIAYPGSLLDAFVRTDTAEDDVGWGNLLRFLSPITISEGLF